MLWRVRSLSLDLRARIAPSAIDRNGSGSGPRLRGHPAHHFVGEAIEIRLTHTVGTCAERRFERRDLIDQLTTGAAGEDVRLDQNAAIRAQLTIAIREEILTRRMERLRAHPFQPFPEASF